MNKLYIINIQKFSVHDGPGIRTTVFFKGCPLRCAWCHNPESQSYKKELLFDREKCSGCGYCVKGCTEDAIVMSKHIHSDNGSHFSMDLTKEKLSCVAHTDSKKCILCGSCTDYCIENNRKIAGKQYEIEELVKILLQDKIFYDQSDGGVTLSGGEVMTQDMNYIEALCMALKKEDIQIAVDTCGYAPKENFARILPYINVFLYDIKALDDETHKTCTGRSNELILSNLEYLVCQKANINVRIPVIQSVNDDEKSITNLIEYIKNHVGNVDINLLPYHNIGSSKYDKLGKAYPAQGFKVPSQIKMEHIKDLFRQNGFSNVKIGG